MKIRRRIIQVRLFCFEFCKALKQNKGYIDLYINKFILIYTFMNAVFS